MPARKIEDEGEFKRWYEEGRTYDWMAAEYLRKYNKEVKPATFAMLRNRLGLPRRIARAEDDALMPWKVKLEHRWAYEAAMLRVEARRRQGFELRDSDQARIEAFKQKLVDLGDAVIHYDPDTEQGFFYVPRRPGVDLDLVREPERRRKSKQ